jgi:hypothetical protein
MNYIIINQKNIKRHQNPNVRSGVEKAVESVELFHTNHHKKRPLLLLTSSHRIWLKLKYILYIWDEKRKYHGIGTISGTKDQHKNRVDTPGTRPLFYRAFHLFAYIEEKN